MGVKGARAEEDVRHWPDAFARMRVIQDLAAEGAGRIVAFSDQARFREAVVLTRQGSMPEMVQARDL